MTIPKQTSKLSKAKIDEMLSETKTKRRWGIENRIKSG
jgi:hypothetical protein